MQVRMQTELPGCSAVFGASRARRTQNVAHLYFEAQRRTGGHTQSVCRRPQAVFQHNVPNRALMSRLECAQSNQISSDPGTTHTSPDAVLSHNNQVRGVSLPLFSARNQWSPAVKSARDS